MPAAGATKIYSGTRDSNGATFVTADGRPLNGRADFRKDSSTVFDWGYDGRGAPAQLALAVLCHYLADDEKARRYYQHFLQSAIRVLPSKGWTLTGAEIDSALPAGAL
jgi:hypothetical protein